MSERKDGLNSKVLANEQLDSVTLHCGGFDACIPQSVRISYSHTLNWVILANILSRLAWSYGIFRDFEGVLC